MALFPSPPSNTIDLSPPLIQFNIAKNAIRLHEFRHTASADGTYAIPDLSGQGVVLSAVFEQGNATGDGYYAADGPEHEMDIENITQRTFQLKMDIPAMLTNFAADNLPTPGNPVYALASVSVRLADGTDDAVTWPLFKLKIQIEDNVVLP